MTVGCVSRERWEVKAEKTDQFNRRVKYWEGPGIKCHLDFQIFVPPSCGKGNPELYWATVKSTGGSSYHLPIMVNPAAHSKFQAGSQLQQKHNSEQEHKMEGFRTVIQHSAIPRNLLSLQAGKKIWFLFAFHLAKTSCWHLEPQKVFAKSLSVLAGFQRCAIQCIKLYTTRKQLVST